MLESEIPSLPHSLNKSLLGVTRKSNGYLDSPLRKEKKWIFLISPVPSIKITYLKVCQVKGRKDIPYAH